MKPQGSYKISSRSRELRPSTDEGLDGMPHALARSELRTQRILASLRDEIVEGGGENLRIRQVFQTPREIYRLELELPEIGYQRTILLDREALEELMETEEVRAVLPAVALGH